MPSTWQLLRTRRRGASRRPWSARIGTALCAFFAGSALLIAGLGFLVALGYSGLAEGLPSAVEIERIFGAPGHERFPTIGIYDRTGQVLLAEALHPQASDRRWLSFEGSGQDRLPAWLAQATIAALDPSFWDAPPAGRLAPAGCCPPGRRPERGPPWPGTPSASLRGPSASSASKIPRSLAGPSKDVGAPPPEAGQLLYLLGRSLRGEPIEPTIPHRLVENTLLPASDLLRPETARTLRAGMLARALTQSYPREQILEWFLNSANYGNLAYGADAAALVYFGKHAAELTLAQAALLAAIPEAPHLNPLDAPAQAAERAALTLRAMESHGLISEAQERRALAELRAAVGVRPTVPPSDLALTIWTRAIEQLGPAFADRSGLRLVTTIDADLQRQVECTARTHLQRLAGNITTDAGGAADGSRCLAAAFIPPPRPSDAGVDHAVNEAAVVVIEVRSGQVLALVGPSTAAHPAGSALDPMLYLTAFSRGFTPGTMVLDIRPEEQAADQGSVEPAGSGPVRMRTALAASLPYASQRVLDLLGEEAVIRTAQQMGIDLFPSGTAITSSAFHQATATLLDLTSAYAVMANQGQMAGAAITAERLGATSRGMDPQVILRIEDFLGNVFFEPTTSRRAVLSPELAYLMADVLGDETIRGEIYGRPNLLELGRPSAVQIGLVSEGRGNWTVGFTPLRAVGAWIGNASGQPTEKIGALNGAAPLWYAVMRQASSADAPEGFAIPAGVSEVQVCDRSGLLPTEVCPHTAREVFIHGTEPTAYDTLYQGLRVNRETGRLATLFTPLDVVEERVYLIPPAEASAWALRAGIEAPPLEYDTLYAEMANPAVRILSPSPFSYVRGTLSIRGDARAEDFEYYRLQVGPGLNPARWLQLGADVPTPATERLLGSWDTTGLEGLYTVQLLVVREGGRLSTSAVQVTVDNEPPSVELELPDDAHVYHKWEERSALLAADVTERLALDRVEFFVDGRRVGFTAFPPYALRWELGEAGEHVVFARAYDVAGNVGESGHVTIRVEAPAGPANSSDEVGAE